MSSSASSETGLAPAEIKKKISKKTSKEFFLSQAALSGSDMSSDDDPEADDRENNYDLADSLIDNNDYSDSHSLYHKLRGNTPNLKPWMNRKLKPISDSIYSQMPEQDDSYVQDSFFVSDSFRTQKIEVKKKNKKKKDKKDLCDSELEICDGWMDGFEVKRRAAMRDNCDRNQMERNNGVKLKRLRLNLSEDSVESEEKSLESDKSGELNLIQLLTEYCNLFILYFVKDSFITGKKKIRCNRLNITDSSDEFQVKSKTTTCSVKPSTSKAATNDNEEDEDFNNWLALTEKRPDANVSKDNFQKNLEFLNKSVNSDTSLAPVTPPKHQGLNLNWLLVDTSLLVNAPDLIKAIRKAWNQDKILIQASLGCDFVLSQRCCVVRFKWSDMTSPLHRQKLIESFGKASGLFASVVVIVVDDREPNIVRTRTKNFDMVMAYLTKAARVLFAKAKSNNVFFFKLSNNPYKLQVFNWLYVKVMN